MTYASCGPDSELFVGWPHFTSQGYLLAVATAQVAGGTLALGPTVHIAAGNTTNPFNPRIAWTGKELGLFWAQDDGSVLLRRFDAGGVPVGQETTVVPAGSGGQTIPSGVLGVGSGYLLTWAVQQPDGGFHTFAASLTEVGALAGGPSLLYAGSGYDVGAALARGNGHTVAVWGTHPETDPTSPVTTWSGTVDPVSGALSAEVPVDEGPDREPTALAVDAQGENVAIYLADEMHARIFTQPAAGALTFAERATLDATSGVALAVDPCGRLAALVPVGALSPENPLSTGLSLQLIGRQGAMGPAVKLPVGSDYVESWDLAGVDGGFVAAWVEGHVSPEPARTLRMAYVEFQ